MQTKPSIKQTDNSGNDINVKKKRAASKVKALIAIATAALLMIILLILNNIDWTSLADSYSAPEGTIIKAEYDFEKPDFEYDIFTDSNYLDKNRYINYTDGAQTITITDGNYDLIGGGLPVLAEYIDSAIHGDADGINSLLTDSYIDEYGEYSAFTMQKIYNIDIELLSSGLITEGEYAGTTQYNYNVKYMIMNNNGTFRRDTGSDAAVPLVFELLSYGGETKINSITSYTYVVVD
ncbi:MAG: hypothetical protein WCQ72_03625 [Eubacteriales bacterium]